MGSWSTAGMELRRSTIMSTQRKKSGAGAVELVDEAHPRDGYLLAWRHTVHGLRLHAGDAV
jgi:hypothetical protein